MYHLFSSRTWLLLAIHMVIYLYIAFDFIILIQGAGLGILILTSLNIKNVIRKGWIKSWSERYENVYNKLMPMFLASSIFILIYFFGTEKYIELSMSFFLFLFSYSETRQEQKEFKTCSNDKDNENFKG